MDESRNTTALILNRQPYREYDSLVTVYSPDYGKLILAARGTKKLNSKLAGHIEPLTRAEIMIIKGKGFDYLGSAVTREAYLGIREDLNKLFFAGRALNIFNRLVKENQADAGLFFLLADWLRIVDSYPDFDKSVGELLFSAFSLKLLAEMGYQPQMYKCLMCGQEIKPGSNYFDLLSGGLVCESCLKGKSEPNLNLLTISDNCVKLIRFVLENKVERAEKMKLDKKLIKELYNLSECFLKFCC